MPFARCSVQVRRGDAGSEWKGRQELPVVLKVFLACSCMAPLLTAVRAYVAYRMGVPANGWEPLADRLFGDLLENRPAFALLHTPDFFNDRIFLPVSYPPFSAILMGALYATGYPIAIYLAVAVAWLFVACWFARKQLLRYGISARSAAWFPVLLVLVSFPIVGLLQRGNIELFVWISAAAGVWAYVSGRNVTAGILWGVAASLKLYPLAFFLLLLSRRAFRGAFAGLASFALASFAAIAYLGPTIAVAAKGSINVIFGYQGLRTAEWSMHELAANHSFFGLVKLAAILLNRSPASWTLPYYAIGGALFLWLFAKRLVHLPEVNQLLAVTVFMLMLPPVSYFYTLVHLYAPWLVLVLLHIRAERNGVTIPRLGATVLLFLPLFISFTLLTYARILLFGGLVQAVVLYGLLACAVQYPFEEPEVLSQSEVPDGLAEVLPSAGFERTQTGRVACE